MKIKKFENIEDNYEDEYFYNVYNSNIDSLIEDNNSDKDVVFYFISTVDDKDIFTRSYTTNLKQALIKMEKLNKSFKDQYCIFECRVSALKKDDITIRLDSRKYNI
jgi:hypothetical protein